MSSEEHVDGRFDPPTPELADFARLSGSQAEQRLVDKRQRLRRMRLASAAAHEGAARAHEEAAALGVGDVAGHRSASVKHRAARDADMFAAEDGG